MSEPTRPHIEPVPKEADCFRILLLFWGRPTVPVSPTLVRQDGQPDGGRNLQESLLRPVFALAQDVRERLLRLLIGTDADCDPANCDQAGFQTWLDALPESRREDILGQLLFGPWDPQIDEIARALAPHGNSASVGLRNSPFFEAFYGPISEESDQAGIPVEDTLIITIPNDQISFENAQLASGLETINHSLDQPEVRFVVIDFSQIVYFSSALVAVLLPIWRQIEERNGQMVPCGLSSIARDVLERTNLDKLWPNYPGRTEALMALHRGSED